jgi:hypothetical protein
MHRIVLRETVEEEAAAAAARPADVQLRMARREYKYNTISRDTLDSILAVEAIGQYGAKIQTLIRHLLWLQLEDPGAKSIVFSAWADSLHSTFLPRTFGRANNALTEQFCSMHCKPMTFPASALMVRAKGITLHRYSKRTQTYSFSCYMVNARMRA